MTIPGFRAEALTEGTSPRWIDELATADPNHLLHVVRGLAPADVVELVGGTVLRHLKPHELPAERPSGWTTAAHAAIGADHAKDLLVAGQRGDWTFDSIDGDAPRLADDEVPDALRAAIEAAGRADSEDEDEDLLDVDANMRIACALVGLTWTAPEFRAAPAGRRGYLVVLL